MNNEKEQRSLHTKNHIANTMFSLLEKQAFNQISVFSLCKTANVSRTTFYLHYQDKYDLVYYCIERVLEPMEYHFSQGRFVEGLRALIKSQYKHRIAMKKLIILEGNDELQYNVDNILLRPCLKYYEYYEKQGVHFDIPARIQALYLFGGIASVMNWWTTRDATVPQETLLLYLLKLFNNRLVTDEYGLPIEEMPSIKIIR